MRTAQARRNASDAIVAEEAGKTAREGRLAGWGGGQGEVAGRPRPGVVVGRVGWQAGSGGGPGGEAGQVGRRAGWGGGEEGRVVGGGLIFGVKNVLE